MRLLREESLQPPVGGVGNLAAGDVKFSGQGFGQSSGAFNLAIGGQSPKAVGYRTDSNRLVRAVPVFAWQAGPLPPPLLACLDMAVACPSAVADDKMEIEFAAAGKAGQLSQLLNVARLRAAVAYLNAVPLTGAGGSGGQGYLFNGI